MRLSHPRAFDVSAQLVGLSCRFALGAAAALLLGSCAPTSAPTVVPPSAPSPPPSPPLPAGPVAATSSLPREPSSTRGGPPPFRFRDISATAGVTFRHESGMHPDRPFPTNFGSGLALLDYDGDGRLDLYCATTRRLPLDGASDSGGNRLYRNRGDGTFEDVTEPAGVGSLGFTHGVSAGDVDGDGFPDLFLTNLGPNVLYLNNGDGTFRDATSESGLAGPAWSTGSALLDFDNDGCLDVYVTCYGQWTLGDDRFCGDPKRGLRVYCPPQSITPVRHYLYRNRGDGTFADVTEAAGVLRRDGRGLGVLAADLNRDGRVDLYVANDGCPNFLFLNRGDGTFEDLTESSGAATDEAGRVQGSMGVDAEDVDDDGWPELFVTNFRGQYSTLYKNLDGRNFQDLSASAGTIEDSAPWVGWGCAIADFDNDGRPDLLAVYGEVDDNLAEFGHAVPFEEPALIWRNRGNLRFRNARDAGPFFQKPHVARGAAFGDLDGDGRLDAVVSIFDGRPAILLNESAVNHWVRLELIGRATNRSAIGAAVEVHAGGRILRRQVKGGGSYLSSSDSRVLIGLGAVSRIDRVEVRWPSGRRTVLEGPASDREHQIVEPRAGDS